MKKMPSKVTQRNKQYKATGLKWTIVISLLAGYVTQSDINLLPPILIE